MPQKRKPKKMTTSTWESTSYMNGLFDDFAAQMSRFKGLTGQLLALEAKIELAEKTLCLTREHLLQMVAITEGTHIPPEVVKTLDRMKFVGVRLADACVVLLQEHKKLSLHRLMDYLNDGTFRFRTNSPFREIHAALLRHPYVKRDGANFLWTAPKEEQISMRLRPSKMTVAVSIPSAAKSDEGKNDDGAASEKGAKVN